MTDPSPPDLEEPGGRLEELLRARRSSLERLRAATEEELQAVEGVGPSMAREIRLFLDGPGSDLIQHLLDAGVRPQEAGPRAEGPLTGKTFVFTGTLTKTTRPEAEELVRSLGGKATGSVSARTDYLVAGEAAGTKLEKAQKLKVAVLDEDGFWELVRG